MAGCVWLAGELDGSEVAGASAGFERLASAWRCTRRRFAGLTGAGGVAGALTAAGAAADGVAGWEENTAVRNSTSNPPAMKATTRAAPFPVFCCEGAPEPGASVCEEELELLE